MLVQVDGAVTSGGFLIADAMISSFHMAPMVRHCNHINGTFGVSVSVFFEHVFCAPYFAKEMITVSSRI